ncbi:22048_t:CDS:2, partial [Cetraspora pellucida]
LPFNFKKTRRQTIKIPYNESQFVDVFGPWIQRYSPCKRKYTCLFKDQSADTTIAIILQDTEWSRQPEIKVEWYTETIIDSHQNTISTGFIAIKFQVDTISYQVQR